MFKVGEKVKFIKEWAPYVKPNFGLVHKKKSKDPNFVWVELGTSTPEQENIFLIPVDKLEHCR